MFRLFKGIAIALFFGLATQAYAQSTTLKIDEGRVVDFLFITDKKDVDGLKPSYFKDIFPPAEKLGFERATFFRISKQPISGEYVPDVLAIGSWPGDWKKRQALFDELSSQRPDIRTRRLAIWSTFNMLNFETKTEVNEQFDSSKLYVLGAYWQNDGESPAMFKQNYINQVEAHKGRIKIAVEQTQTMFGYTEPADLLVITEWESQTAFDAFYEKQFAKSSSHIRYSSEFYLDIPN